ncbi:sigma 54-interacting transcriptional regulator [Bacillus sp. FJAT-29937]|uniref:sigma 54-interacting transcriptional regulator n=1 Tax=Bacillus sp. FJAT-29937 TaxID=1720553 RepID=UPI000ABEB0B8|nr:sigma 54-interacting transcriptional regulator [Bacillus sp. FJAT-29937]
MINRHISQGWTEIVEGIYNGVIIVDRDGKVIMCNTSGCNLIGMSESEMLNKHITSIIEDSTLHQVVLDEVSHVNVQQPIQDRFVAANQSPIYRDGRLIGAISIFQEIPELKNTQYLLEQKEKEVEQLKEIIELLYDGVIMIDKQGLITMMNQTYGEFLGVKVEDVIGKHVKKVIENTRMHVVVKTGQSEIGSFMIVKDKSIIVMRTPIWKEGEVVGAIGKVLYTDINELKTLVQRLNVTESMQDFYKPELKKVRGSKYSFDQIIGEHERMKEVKDLALKVAASRSTVLIRGESGTGKELFAHAIHEASNRSDGPFISLNCAAIPDNLLESELFGYEEGAFSGAKKGGKPGKIEQAQGGTLFLDEVGDMPLNMQVKLLRVLQEKEIERIGGSQTNQIDIRLISATNRPLEEMVKNGEFREDLYYRLNVIHIMIPPLRERGKDIITTAHLILGQLNNELGKSISGFHPNVEDLFRHYQWSGNVREMQNIIERALHIADNGPEICLEHLPPYLLDQVERHTKVSVSSFSLEEEVERAEKAAIIRALKASEGNRTEAAEMLGIHRASLYRKMEKYSLLKHH